MRIKLFLPTILLAAASYISAANWTPSEEYIADAEELMVRFRTALNAEQYRDAYDMLTEGMRRLVPFEEWRSMNRETRTRIGGLLENIEYKFTWYNNPQNAAEPGIYAAIDIVCNYELAAYCTEVLILHRLDGEKFRVMRHEINFIDKKTYDEMQREKREDAT